MNANNKDPITGEPGSHPLGTGVGASTAGVIGAVAGSIAGPLGTVLGGAIGAAVGGMVGHEAAEYVNPTYQAIEPVLQSEFSTRSYAQGRSYADYQEAYSFGAAERARAAGRPWDETIEKEVQQKWEQGKNSSRMAYHEARDAIRDSWHVAERALPGDADGDGR